jgi:hypothetical protein
MAFAGAILPLACKLSTSGPRLASALLSWKCQMFRCEPIRTARGLKDCVFGATAISGLNRPRRRQPFLLKLKLAESPLKIIHGPIKLQPAGRVGP